MLAQAGAVGDICFSFFDLQGELVREDFIKRVIGIEPAALKQVPRRIGVAGGSRKYAAIRGALEGGWINVLITDMDTAMHLVEEGRSSSVASDGR